MYEMYGEGRQGLLPFTGKPFVCPRRQAYPTDFSLLQGNHCRRGRTQGAFQFSPCPREAIRLSTSLILISALSPCRRESIALSHPALRPRLFPSAEKPSFWSGKTRLRSGLPPSAGKTSIAAAEEAKAIACPPSAGKASGLKKYIWAIFGWLCHSTWLFCFSNTLKIYAFYPIVPLVGSVIRGFYWLFLWNFKEMKHQPFSMTQPFGLSPFRREGVPSQ